MRKLVLTAILMLVSVAPALAKSADVYPVSCDALWPAVKLTLNNQGNYSILSINDLRHQAVFVSVDSASQAAQRLQLKAVGDGCTADDRITQSAPDSSDWEQFQHRLAKSLTNLQAENSPHTLDKSADVYPVPCDVLWRAVKLTLQNKANYGLLSVNDLSLQAFFVIVGNLNKFAQRVHLESGTVALPHQNGSGEKAVGDGCRADAKMIQIGAADTDWAQFQHRLAKSLTTLQAEKPKPPATSAATGQQ